MGWPRVPRSLCILLIKYFNYNNKNSKLIVKMQLSAKKQKDLTYLEVQAQQLVNEDDDQEIEVTDEERYNALLAKRQERRAVSE